VPGPAMGHRRLSILDLTEAGRQPFVSADGRYTLVYNGEIFNYRELRAELEALGRRFTTQTDTEVALSAFAQWGTGCFNRFNGMWAMVIWDAHAETLVASRDRFGIKPLYFQRTDERWIFASEVKSIFAHPAARRGVNRTALVSYLMDLGQPDGDETFFEAVNSVGPGTYLVVTAQATNVGRYWDLPEAPRERFDSLGEAAARLEELLRDSVSLRMRSDVRIGTMLSGGLDSTSVISMVRSLMDSSSAAHEATGDTLQSFTAIYRGTEIDEEPLVDELCRSLAVRANKVFPLEEGDLLELLHTSGRHMERPYFNSVPLVHTLLMRKARSAGVKVVLNGHGPDEMLAGYPMKYIPEAIGDSIAALRWREALQGVAAMRDTYGLGRKRALLRALATRMPRSFQDRGLREAAASSPLLTEGARKLIGQRTAPQRREHARRGLYGALHEDFFHQSLPGWLHLEDRISMSESIEARLPFLDYRIVEFAFALPNRFKVEGAVTKRVLRESMKARLPETLVTNLRKVPFSGPDASWIRGPLSSWARSAFLDHDARVFEYLEPGATRALLSEYLDSPKSPTHQYRIWKLVTAEIWMQSMFP
jgi:asparagine synthase (glutamine-hydrolysing)